jgi:putative ABC transport system substrate-binding protein
MVAVASGLALGLVLHGQAHPPSAESRGGTPLRSVVVMSGLSDADDRNVMLSLASTLRGPGAQPSWRWSRIAFDRNLSEAELAQAVRQALQKEPNALIVTTTADMTAMVAAQERQRPILFRMASNPISMCLVDSMRKPGGNATGYTSSLPVESKQIEVLVKSYPAIRTVVILMDDESDEVAPACGEPEPTEESTPVRPCQPGWIDQQTLGSASAALALGPGRTVRYLRLCNVQDVEQMGQWLKPYGAHTGLVVPYTTFFYFQLDRVVQATRHLRLPAVYRDPDALKNGGLMAVAPLSEATGRARGIEQVRRLLAGNSPANIPVQQPEGLAWTLNLRAARESGLIPSKAALRAADHLLH